MGIRYSTGLEGGQPSTIIRENSKSIHTRIMQSIPPILTRVQLILFILEVKSTDIPTMTNLAVETEPINRGWSVTRQFLSH